MHFSVDDTIDIFENITVNNYSSCFEDPALLFFKQMHDEYGLGVSFYCFFEKDNGFKISDCTRRFKKEFEKNSGWLKFGFHALNRKSNYSEADEKAFIKDADAVYENLSDIVSKNALTYNVRLGFAKANKECIKFFKTKYPEFKILYGVDDERIEYYLTGEQNEALLKKGVFFDDELNIEIRLSELRLEKQNNIGQYLSDKNINEKSAFFTHEIYLSESRIKNSVIRICEYANKRKGKVR